MPTPWTPYPTMPGRLPTGFNIGTGFAKNLPAHELPPGTEEAFGGVSVPRPGNPGMPGLTPLPPGSSPGFFPGAPGQGQFKTAPANTQMSPVMRIIMGGYQGGASASTTGPRSPWNLTPPTQFSTPPQIPWQAGPAYQQQLRWDQDPNFKPIQPQAQPPNPVTAQAPVDLSRMNPKFNLLDEYKNWGG